jgi:hypothetical protein
MAKNLLGQQERIAVTKRTSGFFKVAGGIPIINGNLFSIRLGV